MCSSLLTVLSRLEAAVEDLFSEEEADVDRSRVQSARCADFFVKLTPEGARFLGKF